MNCSDLFVNRIVNWIEKFCGPELRLLIELWLRRTLVLNVTIFNKK